MIPQTYEHAAFVRAAGIARIAAAEQIALRQCRRTPCSIAVVSQAQDRRAFVRTTRCACVPSRAEGTTARRRTVRLTDTAEVARCAPACRLAQSIGRTRNGTAFVGTGRPAWIAPAQQVAFGPALASRAESPRAQNRAALVRTTGTARIAAAQKIALRQCRGTPCSIAVVSQTQDR